MTKKELRSMIREEARAEVYRILPDMLREIVGDVLTESVAKAAPRRPKKAKPSRRSILEEIGYGEYHNEREPDIDETMNFDSRDVHSVGARHTGIPVPMAGGLAEMESEMGMSGQQYVGTEEAPAPPPVDMGGQIPDYIASAIGNAKNVLDASQRQTDYRPGKR